MRPWASFVASDWRKARGGPKIQPSNKPCPLEHPMKIHLIQRTISITLAAVITLGLFGGIDHLAGVEGVSGVWAAAVTAQRG
jgi:hypothetical protein